MRIVGAVLVLATLTLAGAACRKPGQGRATPGDGSTTEGISASADPASALSASLAWDANGAEALQWQSETTGQAFGQDRALEASGAAFHGTYLLVTAEKYATVLLIDISRGMEARPVRLAVPDLSELEGIAVGADTALLCDEAHAAVYSVNLGQLVSSATQAGEEASVPSVPVRRLALRGVEVPEGKLGLEGIAVDPQDGRVYLLLERSVAGDGGCFSTVFPLRQEEEALVADGPALRISLEDCTWRLCGLEMVEGSLLALKTKFPGRRYQVVEIDRVNGGTRTLLDLTDAASRFRAQGYGDNLEGLTASASGELWIVSDNAVTKTINSALPEPAGDLTLLMRVPRRDQSAGQ